jgi:endonuclease/exonuclease/phosphatase family metal-dependent hydrolase
MEISLITSNISADFLTPPGVPTWDERKLLYVQVLRHAQPTLMALQEVTPRQLEFLQAQLPEFAALTVPVNDPTPDLLATWQAKYAKFGLPQIPSPYEIILFYRTDTLEPLATGHWWLSPTPDRPSIGFGNTAPRVVLWAQMRQRASSREFFIFNTHIDHRCTRAMVDLCREKFVVFASRSSPLILTGDLNFNSADSNYQLLLDDGWRDSHEVAATSETATFLYDLPNIPGGRIDHILYRGDGLRSQAWARLLPPTPEQRVSDHDPVYVCFSMD